MTESFLLALNVVALLLFVLAPVIAWVLIPVVVRLVRVALRDHYYLTVAPPRWTSVDDHAARLRTRAVWWGVAYGARNLVLAFGACYGGFEIYAELRDGRGVSVVTMLVVVAAWLAGLALHQLCQRLADPLFVEPMYDVGPARSPGIRAFGRVLRLVSRVILVPAVAVAAAVVLFVPVVAYIVAPMLALVTVGALAVDRVGLRMLVRSRKERLAVDGRAPLVYLRDFDDDRLRITTSRVSRRGLAGRLSPSTMRSFEEVMAWRLNRYGPLVAVNDPRDPLTRLGLARLGAARQSLDQTTWPEDVRRWAAGSLAVIVLAAPSAINDDGLGWELAMLATWLPHQRIMLLLPPRRKAMLLAAWHRFCDYVERWPLYGGIRWLNPDGAAHVLVHVPGEGWSAWGARTRSEWTYVAALQLAFEYALPRWTTAQPAPERVDRRGFLVATAAVGLPVAAALFLSPFPVRTTTPTPVQRLTTGTGAYVKGLAVSPDGRTLAGGVGTDVQLWDIATARPVGSPLSGHTEPVNTVAFSPDGRTLASGGWDQTVRLWDVTDPARPRPAGVPLTGHPAAVASVTFSPDGRILASGYADSAILLWTVTDPAAAAQIGDPLVWSADSMNSLFTGGVAFSPDGRTLATGNDSPQIGLWDLTDPARAIRLSYVAANEPYRNTMVSLAFSPNGRLLATGGNSSGVRLWDLTDPTRLVPVGDPFDEPHPPLPSVAFSPNGHVLAAGSSAGTIRLWTIDNPTHPAPLGQPMEPDHAVDTSTGFGFSVAFAPDSRTIASAGTDDTIRIWPIP